MRQNFKTGFTLLELLIVLAIIGLLASIMLVSFSQAQRRARIAQGWQFSDSLRASLQADMVAWWPFDETAGSVAKDNYFNRLNGTVYGAQWTQGIVNGALSFDGVDDLVTVSDSASIDPSAGITISAWVKPNGISNWPTIVSKQAGTNWSPPYARYNLRICTSAGNKFEFWTEQYSGRVIQSITVANTGNWYHVAATYDGSAEKIYINGVLENSLSVSGNITDSPYDLAIGSHGTGGNVGEYWNGLIDEVQIYSGGLRQSQIQQLYSEGLKRHQNLVQK